MIPSDFEGSLVLEKLSAAGYLDDFLDAVDSDDLKRAQLLLRKAGVDQETIEVVLRKMTGEDDSH